MCSLWHASEMLSGLRSLKTFIRSMHRQVRVFFALIGHNMGRDQRKRVLG